MASKRSCPTVQAFDHALAVPLLIVIGTKILIGHIETHRVVERDDDLARSGGHGLGQPLPHGKDLVRDDFSIERESNLCKVPDHWLVPSELSLFHFY
ncbi:hypothetical protein [Pseudomonas sp. LFM046]|uniref:hypothetical protein n=1 Tax=Pseudomonas sp. LFM046 TaxID=1608357 RepID=UPI0005CFB76A|nr:hypothetical protein [Pseudomonas sp. LFM046]